MTDAPGWVAVLAALSGWAAFLYDRWSQRPSIGGQIYQVLIGGQNIRGREYASFLAFLHLTNNRRDSITVLDYELEAFVNDDWIRLRRSYGTNLEAMKLMDSAGDPVKIRKEWMIYWKPQSVERGIPLQGFIQFFGARELLSVKPPAYRLTLIDEFSKRHVITTSAREFGEIYRVFEMAEIEPTAAWRMAVEGPAAADSPVRPSEPTGGD